MRSWSDIILDEKVIICVMAIIFAFGVVLFVRWGVDKEYVSIFGSAVSMLIGALLRGITHQGPIPNSLQDVKSITEVTTKEQK